MNLRDKIAVVEKRQWWFILERTVYKKIGYNLLRLISSHHKVAGNEKRVTALY